MCEFSRNLVFAILMIGLISCSSSNELRKFDEADTSNGVPDDLVKKFEVKDVGSPTPTPSPTPVAVTTKKRRRKKAVKREVPVNQTQEAQANPTPPTRRIDPTPFSLGEKLEYEIRYVGVTAGYLDLEVLPFKQLNNRKVFHLQAKARTVKLFELIYRVNDTIESFWDYDGLFSHKFTMDLDESKQTRKLIELYDYDKKKSFYWNRVDHVQKGYSEKKESYDIPLWDQDPISMLYFLRTLNLPIDPAIELRAPVILDGKPWECVLHFKKKEKIYAGGAYRDASAYRIDTFQNGEVKNKDNTIWISDDEHHYVLRVEAKVKVGSFAIALEKIL